MRRRRHTIPSSGGLLLDTLSNALGAVLFIALLVVLMAQQAPVVIEAVHQSEVIPESNAKLASLPSQTDLAARLSALSSTINDYKQSKMLPQSTNLTIIELTNQLAQWRNKPTPITQQKETTVTKVAPTFRQAQFNNSSLRSYILIFKNGKVYSSDYLGNRWTEKSKDIVFSYSNSTPETSHSVTIIPQHASNTIPGSINSDIGNVLVLVYPSGFERYLGVSKQLYQLQNLSIIPLPESKQIQFTRGGTAINL